MILIQIDLVAHIGTRDEFYNLFREGDEKNLFEGLPLIFYAAANTNPESRYEICNFLLDRNINVTACTGTYCTEYSKSYKIM